MATKEKRISVNVFEKAVLDVYEPTITATWRNIEVSIKRCLSLKDMITFVDGVVKSCFNSDGEYVPEAKEFGVKYSLIKFYTNIALPQNIGKQYDLLIRSDIAQFIVSNIDPVQFSEILNSIEGRIDFLKNANAKVINDRINKLFKQIEELGEQFSDIFKDVDATTMKGLLDSIVNSKLDEEKLIKAHLEQTAATGDDGGSKD